MLVVGRKQGESVMIGDNIEVTIDNVRGSYIRIGIKAPKNILVHRKEVYEAIQKEKAEAQNG